MEAYRALLELVCEVCSIGLESQVWRHVNSASVSSYVPVYQSTSYNCAQVALLASLASATAGVALLASLASQCELA